MAMACSRGVFSCSPCHQLRSRGFVLPRCFIFSQICYLSEKLPILCVYQGADSQILLHFLFGLALLISPPFDLLECSDCEGRIRHLVTNEECLSKIDSDLFSSGRCKFERTENVKERRGGELVLRSGINKSITPCQSWLVRLVMALLFLMMSLMVYPVSLFNPASDFYIPSFPLDRSHCIRLSENQKIKQVNQIRKIIQTSPKHVHVDVCILRLPGI